MVKMKSEKWKMENGKWKMESSLNQLVVSLCVKSLFSACQNRTSVIEVLALRSRAWRVHKSEVESCTKMQREPHKKEKESLTRFTDRRHRKPCSAPNR